MCPYGPYVTLNLELKVWTIFELHVFLELDGSSNIMRWGLCLDDCPHEEPQPACLHPPPVPAFGDFDSETSGIDTKVNYVSNWFDLEYISGNETYFKISKDRERLHQPHWPYSADNVTDMIEIKTEDNLVDFHSIYTIFKEGKVANYTCPEGFIFEDTHNITYNAFCTNWTWVLDREFNASKSCVRKFIFVLIGLSNVLLWSPYVRLRFPTNKQCEYLKQYSKNRHFNAVHNKQLQTQFTQHKSWRYGLAADVR